MGLGWGIKTVWIASAPRCGSMWLFNVTREMVRAAGLEVLPSKVPQTDEAMLAAFEEARLDPTTNRVWVLKIHIGLSVDFPRSRSRFILPRRDLRDTLISYMRFTRSDFEQGLVFVRTALEYEQHYRAFPRDWALFVEYPDLLARPAETARRIAAFLQAPVSQAAVDAAVQRFSKENVARLMKQKEQDLFRRYREGQSIDAGEFVVLGPKTMRVFDTATGFQSGHVSDYREGDWKHILTQEQKSRLEALMREMAAPAQAVA